MSLVYIGLGTATLGRTTRDAEGRVLSSTPAQWTEDDKGGCVMVGKLIAPSERGQRRLEIIVFGADGNRSAK